MAAARLQMMLHDLSLSLSLSLSATHSAHFFCRLRFDYIFLMITTTDGYDRGGEVEPRRDGWLHESGKLRVGRNLNVMQA